MDAGDCPVPGGPGRHGEQDERELNRFRHLHRLPARTPEWQATREQIIIDRLPLVRGLAREFTGRGFDQEELEQIGALALVKAVDGFDPERGKSFPAYAVPTITGEIKRFFRDCGWAIRPPRWVQDLSRQLRPTRWRLTQRLGRQPTLTELSQEVGCTPQEATETEQAYGNYQSMSLNQPLDGDTTTDRLEFLGEVDRGLEIVDFRESIWPALGRLPDRERHILLLYFFGSRTQSDIGRELGLSQVRVSRLMARALEQLRDQLTGDDPPDTHRESATRPATA